MKSAYMYTDVKLSEFRSILSVHPPVFLKTKFALMAAIFGIFKQVLEEKFPNHRAPS